jgi:(R,R)-butanediol dehydrogenase/meso-butanediol dehydrogenase/diacetyl reductase
LTSLVPGGRLAVAALHERPAELQPTHLMMAEAELVGAVGYRPEEFDAVIAAMADGLYDTTGWVREMPLDDVVDAIHALRGGSGTKILIRIS